MRFVAALDTRIYGVPYAQGAEVDITGWSRKQMLQFLGLGIIQASSLTVGAITDSLGFEGNGVTYTVNAEGVFVVTVDPALAGLSDVDLTLAPEDAQALVWDEAAGAWKAGDIAAALAELTDVDVVTTPPVDRQPLEYDTTTSKWIPGTVHSTDAELRDRTTHTGQQPISTITDLQATLDAIEAAGGIFKGVWSHYTGAEVVYDSQVITSAGDLAGIGATVGGPNSYPAPDAAGTPPAQANVLQLGTPSTGSGNFNLTVPAGVTKVRWRARCWLNSTWTTNQELRVNGVIVNTYGMLNWGWLEWTVAPGDGFTLNTQGSFGSFWGYWQIAEVQLVGPEVKLWSLGDYVTYNGSLWRSTTNNNTSTPGEVGATWAQEVGGGGGGGGGASGEIFWVRLTNSVVVNPVPTSDTLVPGMTVTIPTSADTRTAFIDADLVFTGAHTNRVFLYLDGVQILSGHVGNVEGGNTSYDTQFAGIPVALSANIPHVIEMRWNASDSTASCTVVGRGITVTVSGGTSIAIDATGNAVQAISAKTASYTLATGDLSSMITMNAAGAMILSIPTDATMSWPIGGRVDVLVMGAGMVTVAAVTPGTTAVNGTPSLVSRAQWSAFSLYKRAADAWVVIGDMAT